MQLQVHEYNKTLISASAVGTQVSAKHFVGKYRRVALLLRREGHASGSSAFTVKAGFARSPDDSPTMTAYNLLVDNVTNSNAQSITNVAAKTLSSNTDVFLWVNVLAPVTHLEITAVTTTDGTSSAWIIGFI